MTTAARVSGVIIGVGTAATLAVARVFYPRELVLRGGYDLAAGEQPAREKESAGP